MSAWGRGNREQVPKEGWSCVRRETTRLSPSKLKAADVLCYGFCASPVS
jgi:hypothetical protein